MYIVYERRQYVDIVQRKTKRMRKLSGVLLAHGLWKQCLVSVPYPPQTSPLPSGAGSEQLRSRLITPSPQVDEQVTHAPQLAHEPSTVYKYSKEII